ncbi:MAG: hypothetical protein LBU32_19220 [Clostridiales bacterium]|nr:hypothetical protein [Clostridiales bacterium]
MDQCKCTTEGRAFQRLPPFERGEIKALSWKGPAWITLVNRGFSQATPNILPQQAYQPV